MVEVQLERFESVEEFRVEFLKGGGFAPFQTETGSHEAFVFCHEDGFVLLADPVDHILGALDKFVGTFLADSLLDEFSVIAPVASADEFAETCLIFVQKAS